MLIAKVLDKLFNRRNTLEVESLEGDVKLNDISLKEVTEWVAQMKELISYDEGEENIVLNGETGIQIKQINYLVNEDNDSYFPELTEQAGKSVVVNEDETGFEYKDAPILYTTDADFDSLSSELLAKLKVGDLIYSITEGCTALVDYISNGFICLKRYATDIIKYYTYTLEDDEYVYNDTSESISLTPDNFFSQFTYSLADLDSTLRQLVEDAITDDGSQGVACSQAQWNVIKSLLDKSLYLNYNGLSIIKAFTDGISIYTFGLKGETQGCLLDLWYIVDDNLLFARYSEI